ncbi:hypothetical protein TURU_036375 [Turdus rufiventris]|nr:hypothetical protein TURU_036375 [Turdus rufiventris]
MDRGGKSGSQDVVDGQQGNKVDADDVITKEEQIFLLLKAKAKCERHLKAKVPKVHGKTGQAWVFLQLSSVPSGSAVGKPGKGPKPGFAKPGFATCPPGAFGNSSEGP